jgi:hypothetical protein
MRENEVLWATVIVVGFSLVFWVGSREMKRNWPESRRIRHILEWIVSIITILTLIELWRTMRP